MKWINSWSCFLTVVLLVVATVMTTYGVYQVNKGYTVAEKCLQSAPTSDTLSIYLSCMGKYQRAVELIDSGERKFFLGLALASLAQPETHALIYSVLKNREIPRKIALSGGLFLFFSVVFLLQAL